VRRRGSHNFRLSALHAGFRLLTGTFLVVISLSGEVNPRAIVRLEGLSQLKRNPITSSDVEPATFSLEYFKPIINGELCAL
jgi:hypothetical protein